MMALEWLGLGSSRPRKGDEKPDADYYLIGAVGLLLAIGLTMVYSASFVAASSNPKYGSDAYFFGRQLIWAGVGLVGMYLFAWLDYRLLRHLALPLFALAAIGLVLVYLPGFGRADSSPSRWLALGPWLGAQPAELMKLALVLLGARLLSSKKTGVAGGKNLTFGVALTITVALVVLQPDIGTALLLFFIGLVLLFVAGAALRQIFGLLLIGGTALIFLASSVGYRTPGGGFLDPQADPLGIGWHSVQSAVALGSGGLFGLGLGASRGKYFYLYGAHTDSIFAVLGEELGLFGTLLVLGLFLVLTYRAFRLALSTPDGFGALLAAGIATWLGFGALLNIAVATSTVPFIGVPLPFISYGGSSLVTDLLAIGILISISRHGAERREETLVPRKPKKPDGPAPKPGRSGGSPQLDFFADESERKKAQIQPEIVLPGRRK